jgi:gas vesicle structural protein
MAVERVSGGSSLIDVLDRVLDKGIVVDAWVRISMVGIDLLTAGTRVEVASIETCLQYGDDADHSGPGSRAVFNKAGEDGVRELGEVRPHAPRRRR